MLLGLQFLADKETNFLYFFSTVAQTLGALTAFVGVFVIFFLEGLSSSTKDTLSQIGMQAVKRMRMGSGVQMMNSGAMLRAIETEAESLESHPEYGAAAKDIKGLIEQHKSLTTRRKQTIERFLGPIVCMGVVIFLSILGIFFSSNEPSKLLGVLFAFVLIGVFVSIVWTILFAYRALR